MALIYTPSGELGSTCPDFTLRAVDEKTYKLSDFSNKKVLVVLFICNHCPYVQAIEDRMIQLAQEFKPQPVQFIGVCSNHHPEDSFDLLQKRWTEKKYDFPYLHDETQDVAKKFSAVCTPDIFVYNQQRHLTYRGRLDDSWKEASKVQRQDLKEAVLSSLKNEPLSFEPIPSMGCSIKWKNAYETK